MIYFGPNKLKCEPIHCTYYMVFPIGKLNTCFLCISTVVGFLVCSVWARLVGYLGIKWLMRNAHEEEGKVE